MSLLPLGTTPSKLTVGGSPRGWSFISSAACWFRWLQRYTLGLFANGEKSYFSLGSAFHMFMEGKGKEEVEKRYPGYVDEAVRLKTVRLEKGPPLGRASRVEHEYALFGGKMTSKPDREEVDRVGVPWRIRDYKTSAMGFRKDDQKRWDVAGGIIGEIIAGNVTEGIVDIVSKRRGDGDFGEGKNPVKLVTVLLTPEKRKALERHVDDFWSQLETRVKAVAAARPDAQPNAVVKNFPRNLNACVDEYGPCDYYDRCWGKPPESMLYTLAPQPPRAWLTGRPKGEGIGPLPLPWKSAKKDVETLYKATKVLFGFK